MPSSHQRHRRDETADAICIWTEQS